jgi:integrase
MARPKGREPRVDIRRYRLKDGTIRENPGVRYYDADGTCRRVGFASLAEAELERARMVVENGAQRPGAVDGSTTLEAFWPVWLADARERLAEGTVEDYVYFWRRRVAPRFGEHELRAITPRAVSQWRATMAADGVGRESIRKAMILLQAMLSIAIEWGEASENPVRLVRKPKQPRQRAIEVMEPGTVERLRAAMQAAGDPLSATLTVLLAYSGLRPAEALALERRHVREATILVEQAVSRGKLKQQKTGRVYRTLDLLTPLSDDLDTWFALRGIQDRDAPLFPRADGGWWMKDDWDNWRGRRFHRYTRSAGLGTPRPYDLRHSFVSLLICEQQSSVVDIADQLGHSPNETLKTYSHVMRERRRQKPVQADELIAKARRAAQQEFAQTMTDTNPRTEEEHA